MNKINEKIIKINEKTEELENKIDCKEQFRRRNCTLIKW